MDFSRWSTEPYRATSRDRRLVPVPRKGRRRGYPLLAATFLFAGLGVATASHGATGPAAALGAGDAVGAYLLVALPHRGERTRPARREHGTKVTRALAAYRPERRWNPASLTKLMTLYVVFERLAHGELSLTDRLPISARAQAAPPTRLGLHTGDHIRLETAVAAAVVASANDAAVVLAEAVAGDEKAFVTEMNRTALALGLRDTRFRNATGLPGPGQWTTARDMAVLARGLLERHAAFRAIFSRKAVRYQGRVQFTHLGALRAIPGSDGMKTGFTCAAGYNVVLSVERNGRRLLAVVLGARSRTDRDRFARSLIEKAFREPPPVLRPIAARPLAARDRALPPPVRLDPEDCAPRSRRAPFHWVRRADALRGWGVYLGLFSSPRAARRHLRRTMAPFEGRLEEKGDPSSHSAPGSSMGSPGSGPLHEAPAHATQGDPDLAFHGRAEPALLTRHHLHRATYKLVVAGLTRSEAGRLCRGLRRTRTLCIAQSPERMASLGYAQQ